MELSRQHLASLTLDSVDPEGLGRMTRLHDNVDLTDDQLVMAIMKRNAAREPTYALRYEYRRRLDQRGL